MSESNENKTSKPVILKATSLNFLKLSSIDEKIKNSTETNIFKNNPFAKVADEDEKPSEEKAEEKSAGTPDKNNSEKTNEKKSDSAATTKSSLPKLNLFSNAGSTTAPSSFVFGQNLHERVVGESVSANNSQESEPSSGTGLLFSSSLGSIKTPDKDKTNDTGSESASPAEKNNASPSTSEAAAQQSSEKSVPSTELNGCASTNSSNDTTTSSLSLIEAARKYEEARGAQKRKYEEVETITGEEDENNILEINCKLFTFIDQNWEERGRGMLRLNDSKKGSYSRVVFRASGSLRVLLNTKVWSDMVCERASQKSLRLTALDGNGHIKIYLMMGRNEDIHILQKSLSRRIDQETSRSSATKKAKEDPEEPSVKKPVLEEAEKSE